MAPSKKAWLCWTALRLPTTLLPQRQPLHSSYSPAKPERMSSKAEALSMDLTGSPVEQDELLQALANTLFARGCSMRLT